MEKCTFCGREANCGTKHVGGYTILEVCTDCEREIIGTVDKIHKGRFALGGEIYHGYTAGQTWNGWEWPLLPQEEMIRFLNNIVKDYNELEELLPEDGMILEQPQGRDEYILWDDKEAKDENVVTFIASGGDYEYNGQTIHLYDCGSTYCWEEVTEAEYREIIQQSELIKKMHECLDLCETQIETSGGDGENEILSGITLADIQEMRNLIDTVLGDGIAEVPDELPEITADDLRDYQGR